MLHFNFKAGFMAPAFFIGGEVAGGFDPAAPLPGHLASSPG